MSLSWAFRNAGGPPGRRVSGGRTFCATGSPPPCAFPEAEQLPHSIALRRRGGSSSPGGSWNREESIFLCVPGVNVLPDGSGKSNMDFFLAWSPIISPMKWTGGRNALQSPCPHISRPLTLPVSFRESREPPEGSGWHVGGGRVPNRGRGPKPWSTTWASSGQLLGFPHLV